MKKKDSKMSIISCILVGVALILPMPIILSFPLSLAGVIVGLIDIGAKNKEFRHLGSWFGTIAGIIVIFFLAIQFM